MDDRKRGVTRPPAKTVTIVTEEPGKTAAARPAEQPQRPAPRRRPELTAEEERVLRMRYGIAGAPDLDLEFEGQEFEDTRLQLALIEQRALEMLARRGTPTAPGPKGRDSSTKDKIIRKLRDI